MRSVIGPGPHPSDLLEVKQCPLPEIRPSEVLVRVHAAGINRADLAQARRAMTSRIESDSACVILGREMAGEVISVGESVSGLHVGDRVMGMTDGAFANYIAVDHRLLLSIPRDWSWVTGAAFAVRSMTAHDALVSNGRMVPGERILITAASSTVGATAVQLARVLGAGEVVAMVRSPHHEDHLLALGADQVIQVDHRSHSSQEVDRLLDDISPDVVVDLSGGFLLNPIVSQLRVKGRIVSVGRLSGDESTVNLGRLARKRGVIVGVSFTSRGVEEAASVAVKMWQQVEAYLDSTDLAQFPTRAFPVSQVNEALRHTESRSRIEKVVLQVD